MATGIKSFRYGGSPLLAWLYTIARNLVIDHHRRSKREASLPANNRWETDKEHVEQAVEQQLSHEKLATALQEITEDQRQVIWLKFIEGLSNPETAQILGKTVGAVKSLQHRALASLQRILQGI